MSGIEKFEDLCVQKAIIALQLELSRKAADQCNPKPFTSHLSEPVVEELIATRIKHFTSSTINIELDCGSDYPKIPLCVGTFIPKGPISTETISDRRAIALRDSSGVNTILLTYFEAVAGKIPIAEPQNVLMWKSIVFVKKFHDSRPNELIADTLRIHAMEYFMNREVHLTKVSGRKVAKTLGIPLFLYHLWSLMISKLCFISYPGLDRQPPRILRRQIKGAVSRLMHEKSEAVFQRLYANLMTTGEADNDWTILVCAVLTTTAFIEMRQVAFLGMGLTHSEMWPLADCIKSCRELEVLCDEIFRMFLARYPGTQCHVPPEDIQGLALVRDMQAFSQSALISKQRGELPDLHETTWEKFNRHNSGRLIANFLTKAFQFA